MPETEQKRDLARWRPVPGPDGTVLRGRFVRCEPLSGARHAATLHNAFAGRAELWEFMPWGPFSSAASFHRQVADLTADPAYHYYALCDPASGKALGKAAYMRVKPKDGVIEVGGIAFSPALQKSAAATEAMILMMRWAFGQGYRRYEWKCDARNLPSRRAAQRLGFSYEGVFRNHMVVKGKNRDTAWFAVTDAEWPALNEAFSLWLAPGNFDAAGKQRERLSGLTRLVRVSEDPAQAD